MPIILLFVLFPLLLMGFDPKPVTPYPVVGYQESSFNDWDHGAYRQLMIWYPVDSKVVGTVSQSPWDTFKVAENAPIASSKSKRALIVLSHGYTGNPHQLSWLIQGLINHDFIVLSVQHNDLIDGKVHLNHWERAKDITKIINQFSAHPLSASTDMNKIGIAGYSLGGTTAIWITGGRATKLQNIIPGPDYASPEDYELAGDAMKTFDKGQMPKEWRDKRVKAAFVMAPGWAWLFDEVNLRTINVPTYLMAAAGDKTLVSRNNAGYFARFIPKAIYQEIPGKAGHYIFISAINEQQQNKADPEKKLSFLFEDNASIDRLWIQQQVIREAVNFYNSVFIDRSTKII